MQRCNIKQSTRLIHTHRNRIRATTLARKAAFACGTTIRLAGLDGLGVRFYVDICLLFFLPSTLKIVSLTRWSLFSLIIEHCWCGGNVLVWFLVVRLSRAVWRGSERRGRFLFRRLLHLFCSHGRWAIFGCFASYSSAKKKIFSNNILSHVNSEAKTAHFEVFFLLLVGSNAKSTQQDLAPRSK